MNLKTACILLFLILAGLMASAGCTATTGPSPPTPVLTPDTITPVRTTTPVTPLPVNEIARITVGHFGMNPSTESIYEFVGTVQVNDGVYQSVQVILRYPDTQEYTYDAGGMGGSNVTIKPFFLYPSDHYKGTNPGKILALDGKRYATLYRYENGVLAWIATSDNQIVP